MARQALTIKNVPTVLEQLSKVITLPTGLSHEFVPDQSGGTFTGNVVISAPRTETGILADVVRNFGPIVSLSPSGIAQNIGTSLVKSLTTKLGSGPAGTVVGRLDNMSFEDGDSGFSLPTLGDIGSIFQGQLGQSLLNIGTTALTGFVNQQFSPGPIQTNMAAAPAIGRAVAGGAVVARGFFNKFPNLAAGIQRLRNAGQKATRGNLWSLMKRFGPDFLISGGILTAAAVSELAMAGPGRRRMNPGNVKALRRAHRRMKSFHHVCQVNDHLLAPRRRRTAPAGNLGRSIVAIK